MNRSTPIQNLQANTNPTTFVNDQQRQIVMQAQQAINNMQMPQNTQLNQNMDIADDDATIQEVLNQIQAGTSTPQTTNAGLNATQQAQLQSQLQQFEVPQQQLQNVQLPNISYPSQPPQPAFAPNMVGNGANFFGQMPPQPSPYLDPESHNGILGTVGAVAQDVKLAAFVFILFVVVQFIPIDKFLLRYFAFDKIPYYQIILKALLAFVAVIFLKKFIM